MTMQFFAGRGLNGERIFLPLAYRKKVKWLPQIGDIVPNFEATTTEGRLKFFDWAEGHWSIIFSHPAACTPVCTTEIVSLVGAKDEFESRNVKLLGFTQSSTKQQDEWHNDIFDVFGVRVNFPIIDDRNSALAKIFGMIHAHESQSWPIRKTFILDPQMKIRMIFEYPIYVGRSTQELLRAVDALQAIDKLDVAIPADWRPGEPYLSSENHDIPESIRRYGKRAMKLLPYLTLIEPEAVPLAKEEA